MLHTRIFQFNPLGTNCMVLWADGSRSCTVVDPGMSSDEGVSELTDFLKREGLTPDAILLTHGHFDHVTAVPAVRAARSDEFFSVERHGAVSASAGDNTDRSFIYK